MLLRSCSDAPQQGLAKAVLPAAPTSYPCQKKELELDGLLPGGKAEYPPPSQKDTGPVHSSRRLRASSFCPTPTAEGEMSNDPAELRREMERTWFDIDQEKASARNSGLRIQDQLAELREERNRAQDLACALDSKSLYVHRLSLDLDKIYKDFHLLAAHDSSNQTEEPTVARGPACSPDELFSCLTGYRAEDPMGPKIPGVVRGGAPRGEGFEDQYNWIMALALPNPRNQALSDDRPEGIWETDAVEIFEICFKGEEAEDRMRQQANFQNERISFLEGFRALPPAPGEGYGIEEEDYPRRYAGAETEESSVWYKEHMMAERTQEEIDGMAHNFLELLRNQIVTKLTMHCQLAARTCYTEDHESVLVIVTCTAKDLLREADSQGFPTELDIRAVDPVSLEPCCPVTFYPLLDWYLKHSPNPPPETVVNAYWKVASKLVGEPDDEREILARELNFWNAAGLDIDRNCKEKSKGAANAAGKGHGHGSLEEANIGGTTEHRRHVLEAFVAYMELKAEQGLTEGDPTELIKTVNQKFGKGMLINWHTAIGLQAVSAPYKSFRLGSYQGPSARPWEWRAYETRSRAADSHIVTPFNGSERVKLTKSIIDRQLDLPQLQARELIISLFPLDTREKHENCDLMPKCVCGVFFAPGSTQCTRCGTDRQLAEEGRPVLESEIKKAWGLAENVSKKKAVWLFLKTLNSRVPVDAIREYYGERIALYFALVETIKIWLVVPGVIGVIAFLVQTMYPYQPHKDPAPRLRVVFDLLYGFTVSIWGTLLLEWWKRRQICLALHWGQRGINKIEVPRPRFKGLPRRSPITYDDNELHYRGRWKWQLLSNSVLLGMALGEVCCTVLIGMFRGVWVQGGDDFLPFSMFAPQATALIGSGQMGACQQIGRFLSGTFNDWENLRTGTDYVNALITKNVVHELWNRFNLYFYVAFVKGWYEGCVIWDEDQKKNILMSPEDMNGKMCLEEMVLQLRVVLLVEMSKNFVEIFLPLVLRELKFWMKPPNASPPAVDRATATARMAHFCQEAMERESYGELEIDGTFQDYLEIVILFCHFTLFSLVFPLTPAMGCFLLMIELRVDGFKLFNLVRRPLPIGAEDIGNWYALLNGITWLAMLTNSALLVFTFGIFDDPPGYFGSLDPYIYWVLLICCLVLFKSSIANFVSDEPESVIICEEHQEWIREQVDLAESGEAIAAPRDKVDIAALDLSIDDAHSGQLRDPMEFGMTPVKVIHRASRIRKKREQAGMVDHD